MVRLHKTVDLLIFFCLDVKPDNVIVDNSGDVKLIDFGCAVDLGSRRTGFLGTSLYASNNSLSCGVASEDDDFDSLCYTLYSLDIGLSAFIDQKENRASISDLSKHVVVRTILSSLIRT